MSYDTQDFLPTAMELAGIAPSKAPPKIDGHSFAPVLLGKTIPQPRFLYHEFGGPQVRFLTEILDDLRRFVDEIWRFETEFWAG